VKIQIENVYENGYEFTKTEEIAEPAEVTDEWWETVVMPLTGGICEQLGCTIARSHEHISQDAWYDVTIVEATNPALVGQTHEWGY
jgi:hypothetical protein